MDVKYIQRFIKKNHFFVESYYQCYYKRYKENDWKEQLRILFLNALSSEGQGNLTAKGETIKEFENCINKMNSPTYMELLKVFDAKDYLDLFNKLKSLKQIASKKSALILRDILFFGNIIEDVPSDIKKQYLVPVDRVIIRTINSLFEKKYKNGEKSFIEINDLAKDIFPDEPILLEDLWFWGRFYRCKEDKKGIPFCRANHSLLLIDTNVTKEFRNELLSFFNKQKECPFKEICLR